MNITRVEFLMQSTKKQKKKNNDNVLNITYINKRSMVTISPKNQTLARLLSIVMRFVYSAYNENESQTKGWSACKYLLFYS